MPACSLSRFIFEYEQIFPIKTRHILSVVKKTALISLVFSLVEFNVRQTKKQQQQQQQQHLINTLLFFSRSMSSIVPRQVEIYAIFCKLNSVNTVQNKFDGEVDIVSSWLDNIHERYDSDQHWNPQLVCENTLDAIKIQTRVEIQSPIDETSQLTRIVQYQKFSGVFSEWLHVKQFPFDIQKIGRLIRLSSSTYLFVLGVQLTSLHPISRISLVGKPEYCYLARKAMRENDCWDFNQTLSIEYGTYQEHTPYFRSQQYPSIRFNALIARKSQYYITNLILPLFFVTATIFVSFTQDVSSIAARLSACATTLLTSINFRFVIHNYLPNVPYSTYLDFYSMASIVFITVVFSWHAYSTKQLDRLTYAQLDLYVFSIFGALFVIGHILFIVFAWILPKRRQKAFLKLTPHTINQMDEKQPVELENLLGYERSGEKIAVK